MQPTLTPSSKLATGHGVAAILLWSSFALLAVFTADLPPFQVLATGFAIGGALGVGVLALRGRGALAQMRQPLPAFALAVVALFGYHALYFFAFRHAPAVEVNLINYLWPLLIVVFAAFLPGVRPRVGQFAGTAIALLGVIVMLTRGEGMAPDPAHRAGHLAALGAALTWATYSVLNRRFRKVPTAAMAGSCVAVAILAALVHFSVEVTRSPSAAQWAALVLMGAGPVGVAFWLWDSGTKHGNLALLGTLSYAGPLLSTLLLLLGGKLQPHWTQALALALLLAGAWMSVRASARS